MQRLLESNLLEPDNTAVATPSPLREQHFCQNNNWCWFGNFGTMSYSPPPPLRKTMASCQNPLIPRMTWIAPPRGLLGRGTRRACREHANDTATHVELPVKKIWYSESASTRHDSVALHRRGYGMR